MNPMTHRAEAMKLAQTLNLPLEQLSFLDKLSADELSQTRETISSAIFDGHSHLFARIASTSKLVPASISAVISERALGPWLCAHVAAHMPTATAIDIAKRLPTPFLADVCQALDPRRAQPIIQGIPLTQTVAVALELIRRRDFLTMGRFVDSLPEATIHAVMAQLQDDSALLPIAFYASSNQRLSSIAAQLEETRLLSVIAAASAQQQWPQALAFMSRVDAPNRQRLSALAAQQSDAVLNDLVLCVQRDGLWSLALPLVAVMLPESQARFMRLAAVQEPGVLAAILDATHLYGLWAELLPLLAIMEADMQTQLSRHAEALSDSTLQEVIRLAHAQSLWLPALDMVLKMRAERRTRICLLVGQQDALTLVDMLAHIGQAERWEALFSLLEEMPLDAQQSLLQQSLELGVDYWSRLMAAAENTPAWDLALHSFARSEPRLQQRLRDLMQDLPAEQQGRIRNRAENLGLVALFI